MTARHTIAFGLALVLLGMAGLMYPATVPHAAHHASHHAGTHGTALCTWLCAAGQTAESPVAPITTVFLASDSLAPTPLGSIEWTFPLVATSRAPPALSI